MPTRNYYVDVEDGYLDAILSDARKVAIDYLMDHKDTRSMIIYTSASKRKIVGTVELSESLPYIRWTSSRGCSSTLDRFGRIVKYN